MSTDPFAPETRYTLGRCVQRLVPSLNQGCVLQIGLKLAGLAGYNITKAPEVWDDMARLQKGPGGDMMTFLQTHPGSKNRAAVLRQELEAMGTHGWGAKSYASVFTKPSYFSV